MKAVILAAGKGTRIQHVEKDVPKVMIRIGGKPLLQFHIENLRKYGILDIFINTHYLPEKIYEYFGDGTKFGVNIQYSKETELLGTSGAINNFREFLQGESFFVIYGDVLHSINFLEMYKYHLSKKGIGIIALDNRSQIGRSAVIIQGDQIVGFVEKPKEEISGAFVNSGIYVLEPEILDYIPKNKFSDFGHDIFPLLLKNEKKLFGFNVNEVIDIGKPEDLEYARSVYGL